MECSLDRDWGNIQQVGCPLGLAKSSPHGLGYNPKGPEQNPL